jgi:subtilisin family serine protease
MGVFVLDILRTSRSEGATAHVGIDHVDGRARRLCYGMRFSLASSLAVAIASALVLSGCRVPPAGEMQVQRINASTQRALVYADAGIGSPASHVRVTNVGEPGSSLRFEVEVPTGMTSSVTTATLGAGEWRDVAFGANAPSRDATVVVRANGQGVAVPVRVVADDGLICAPGLASAAAASAARGGPGAPPLAGADTTGIEVVVTYAAEPIRRAAVPAVARRQVAARALASASALLVRPGGVGEHDLAVVPDAAALERLRRAPGVALVAPNVSVYRSALPNDAELDEQWWLQPFGVADGWAVQAGTDALGDDVTIAIVDDGVNTDHLDLKDKIVAGCDVYDFDGDVRAASHHGSHVAGLAAATGDNAFGIAGIGYGPAVRLLVVKIFPDDPGGNGTLDAVLRGMRWAAGLNVTGLATNDHPADVINMSFGFGDLSPDSSVAATLAAVASEIQAGDHGIRPVMIAAAGNRGSTRGVELPARLDEVIAVGSVDADGRRSAFSTHGDGLHVVAPGGSAPSGNVCIRTNALGGSENLGLLSLGSNDAASLVCSMGTSMATPIVAGTVALLMLEQPALRNDPEAVAAHLAATAWRAPWIGDDEPNEYGAGIVCLDAVLAAGTVCGAPGP